MAMLHQRANTFLWHINDPYPSFYCLLSILFLALVVVPFPPLDVHIGM